MGESALLKAVTAFYADRLFGPHCRELLAAELSTTDISAAKERDSRREHQQRTLADLTRRQENTLRQAQGLEPGDAFAQGLRATYNDLEKQRATALTALQSLHAMEPAYRLRRARTCWTPFPASACT